jgi:hypothetical protein
MALPELRYSKIALLLFGAGLMLGLAVVSAELSSFGRTASLAMALGIVALPVAAVADLRRIVRPKTRRRSKSPKRKPPPQKVVTLVQAGVQEHAIER